MRPLTRAVSSRAGFEQPAAIDAPYAMNGCSQAVPFLVRALASRGEASHFHHRSMNYGPASILDQPRVVEIAMPFLRNARLEVSPWQPSAKFLEDG